MSQPVTCHTVGGRGLRVWSDMPPREQSCLIIAPDDPRMEEFLEHLRGLPEDGLQRVKEREAGGSESGPSSEGQLSLSYVESAVATTTRAASNDTDVESDELLLIESIKVEVDSAEDATKFARFLELYGIRTKRGDQVPGQRNDLDNDMIVQVPWPSPPGIDVRCGAGGGRSRGGSAGCCRPGAVPATCDGCRACPRSTAPRGREQPVRRRLASDAIAPLHRVRARVDAQKRG
ncbi:hypothetical protein [Streptomyces venezuelae]|uniref:hypothetical protein n=1 Tax=Streptomyces venezuelae TaxID=54571 RepID=UPI00332A7B23